MRALLAVVLCACAVVAQHIDTLYAPPEVRPSLNQPLCDIAMTMARAPQGSAGQGIDNNHGLAHLLHASLHQNIPPSYLENGQMVTELHPPVKIIITKDTKARRIPNKDAEVQRKLRSGSVVVGLATTNDLRWIQIGKNEFVRTSDCNLEESINREDPQVLPLHPPLPIFIRGSSVSVRKVPDFGGKTVTVLRKNAMVTAYAVTPDRAWIKIGDKMYVPTIACKLGDPITPLRPPLTIHLLRDSVVLSAPDHMGRPVNTLHAGDIMQAIGVSSDLKFLKIGHNNFVRTIDCKLGYPAPPSITFPRPVVIKLIKDAKVVKNPNEPDQIIRWLKQDDELQAFGASADFKWIKVAKKRYIPMDACRMKAAFPKPIILNPPVGIKIAKDTPVRNVPDQLGHAVSTVHKGDKLLAIAVSVDFTWLQLGKDMWIPLMSAYFRKPEPKVNPLVPPLKVVLLRDAKVYKTPDNFAEVVKVLGEGETVPVVGATPDLEWLKLADKQYITSDSVKYDEQLKTAPIFPFLKVVVNQDTKVYKQPSESSLPVRRIKRGGILRIHETTPNLKWLKIGDNQFIPTQTASYVAHTIPLTPAVRMTVAADIKVKNVPAYAGMSVRSLKKGEIVSALEVTPDYRWVKLSKDQYIPAGACVLQESEGKDMQVVLKIRSENVVKDPIAAPTQAAKSDTSVTTSQAVNLLEQAFEKRIPKQTKPAVATKETSAPVVDLKNQIKKLRIKEDTLVMSAPAANAVPVRGIRKGTLVDATALGTNLVWLKIGPDQYVRISATEPTDDTTKKTSA